MWIEVEQNRPGAVVETPTIVASHQRRCKQSLDPRSKVGITWRGVLQLIQLARKAAEVMDRPRSSAYGDGRIFDVPVRGDREYRLGPRQGRADLCPPLCIGVCQQRIHGIPVPNEQRWHPPAHFRIAFRHGPPFALGPASRLFASACPMRSFLSTISPCSFTCATGNQPWQLVAQSSFGMRTRLLHHFY
jgi:hypothetical protein